MQRLSSSSADYWRLNRIWVAIAFGVWLPGAQRLLEFWPLSSGLSLEIRAFVDLSRIIFFPCVILFASWLIISALIAAFRQQIRKAAIGIIALSAMPLCFAFVSRTALLDPWLWYVLVNDSHFRTQAAKSPDFTVLSDVDISTGLAGISGNHFIFLIYDNKNEIGLEPYQRSAAWQTRVMPGFGSPFPRGHLLVDHIFKVDVFE